MYQSATELGPHGLWIVEQIARHWWQRRETGGGKTVYALLGLPADNSGKGGAP